MKTSMGMKIPSKKIDVSSMQAEMIAD